MAIACEKSNREGAGEREKEAREGRQCKEGRVSVKKAEREIIYNPDAQSACKL